MLRLACAAAMLVLAAATASGALQCPHQPMGAGTCYRSMAIKRLLGLDAPACCAACVADVEASCGTWELTAAAPAGSEGSPATCILKAPGSRAGPCPATMPNTTASGTIGAAPPPPPAPAPQPKPGPDGSLKFNEMFMGVGTGTAVIAAGKVTSVWGWAPPAAADQTVRLLLDGKLVSTGVVSRTADGNATWLCSLPPQAARYGATLAVQSGSEGQQQQASTVVAFGMVVLCSGQSNMGMNVGYGAPNTPPSPGKKPSFSADNGTAETANAPRYTGKIMIRHDNGKFGNVRGIQWQAVTKETLGGFSAVCWYAGRNFFDTALAEQGMPLGLVLAAVGGSPIEYWIPPQHLDDVQINPCEVDSPQCDNSGNKTDSIFWTEYMLKMVAPEPAKNVGYRFNLMVWDQAERDVKCPRSLAAYPCMQSYLLRSWQQRFSSPDMAFVGVQLAGYTAAINNGTGRYDLSITPEMVFAMRRQQEAGCKNVTTPCAVVPTYDYSCSAGTEGGCPYGSVHQPDKPAIGQRLGKQLHAMLVKPPVPAPMTAAPRATHATAVAGGAGGEYTISVHFSGGSGPFYLRGTRNCTWCCDKPPHAGFTTVDFDASVDGRHFVNGTGATLQTSGAHAVASASSTATVTFVVRGLSAVPRVVRHTAASTWPQCALYNAEGFPAFPFQLDIADDE
jgi:hypothetical protein